MTKIDKMSSQQAAKARTEAEKRHKEVRARLAQIRPSTHEARAKVGAGPGTDPDSLAGAGPEYRKVVLEGTPDDMAKLEEEHRRLEAEGRQLAHRISSLRQREKHAAHEEAVREAPARAKAGLDALPDILDRVDALLVELADALDEKEARVREIEAARKLTEGPPYWSPELLRRVWALDAGAPLTGNLLRPRVSTRRDELPVIVPAQGGGRMVDPSFRADVENRLKPPVDDDFEALRREFASEVGPQVAPLRARQEQARRRKEHAERRAHELAAPRDG